MTPSPNHSTHASKPAKLRLALSILCENPQRKTGLTTLFHELVSRSLKLDEKLEWIVFAGRTQEWTVESPRVSVVRRYPANDHLIPRLWADHFRVPGEARRRGADALLTVGFVPLQRAGLPVVLHLFSLQHLDRTNRTGLARRVYRLAIMNWSIRQAQAIVTNSKFAAGQILHTYPTAAGRLVISSEGLQHEQFNPAGDPEEAARLAQRYGLAPGCVLWVSNFYPYKQAPLLLEAYARLEASLRARHPLVMVGGNWQGGRDDAQARCAALGITGDVRFLGWVDDADLAPLYRQARAVVLSSREETFGRCVIESMACGTPCVVNDIPAMREVTGGHAVLVDFNDAAVASAGLASLLKEDDLHVSLSAAGKTWTEQYSFERLTTERLTAIRAMLGRMAPRG